MHVLILHNTTTLADLADDGDPQALAEVSDRPDVGRALAIFRRMPEDNEAPIERGDRLAMVGQLTFTEITGTDDDAIYKALNAAYAAGNAPGGPYVDEYRTWQVRSLSVGDVVLTQGRAFAVAGCGWQEIDARWSQFKVLTDLPGEAHR